MSSKTWTAGPSAKLKQLRSMGQHSEAFREGYEARDALIRFGDMLRRVRESSGLTQAELAEKTGMTQPAVSRLESGFGQRGPEMETVMRFVHGCNAHLVIGIQPGMNLAEEDEQQSAQPFNVAM